MIKKMTYINKTKLRMNLGIMIAIVGVITVSLALTFGTGIFANGSHYEDFNSGFFAGLGGGLIGAGILTFYKNRKLLKNPDKLKEKEIKETDERNIYLNQKALSVSAMIWISLLYVAMIGAVFFDNNISMVLVTCGGVALAIYLIVYTVLEKMY